MANLSAPKGLVPLRHLNGSPFNGQFQLFYVPATDGEAIYVGDIVKWGGTSGAANVTVNGMNVEGMATVTGFTHNTTPITVGTSIAGVVRGFLPDPTNLMTKHRAASTARIAMVITDPTVVYELQEDAVTNPWAAADVGLNGAFVPAVGSATTGVSGFMLNSLTANKATTNTLPIRVLGLVKKSNNAFNTAGSGSDPGTFEVMINASGNVTPPLAGGTGT